MRVAPLLDSMGSGEVVEEGRYLGERRGNARGFGDDLPVELVDVQFPGHGDAQRDRLVATARTMQTPVRVPGFADPEVTGASAGVSRASIVRS